LELGLIEGPIGGCTSFQKAPQETYWKIFKLDVKRVKGRETEGEAKKKRGEMDLCLLETSGKGVGGGLVKSD